MLKKIFTPEGIKSFFKVRDDEGNFSWEEFGATVAQLALILGTIYFLNYLGLI